MNKIVFVEDDAEVGALIAAYLGKHDMDVVVEPRGDRAEEVIAREKPDLVLTVEASGIAVAITTAQAFGGIPVVFAKKCDHRNVGHDVYTAQVYSFTHQTMSTVRVSRKYLPAGARVLIIDDFLANGEAIEGLRSIVAQAGCELVGAGVCVEKGFQPGGRKLREEGVKVVSLAIVDAIEDGHIRLRDD